MGSNSAIEWTDHTFNAWRGCVQVADHPACEHCYAMTMSKRNPAMLGVWGDASSGGTRVVASESMWREPIKWNAAAQASGTRARVFCASLADVFEDWNGRIECGNDLQPLEICRDTGEWSRGGGPYTNMRSATMHDLRRRLFTLIDATPHLDWLLLTKRPENVRKFWPSSERGTELYQRNYDLYQQNKVGDLAYRPNVWLGTSISDQTTADKYVPELLKCRDLAPVLFLSVEPLLGPIDLEIILTKPAASGLTYLSRFFRNADGSSSEFNPAGDGLKVTREVIHPLPIDWVIAGGESGPHARPMHPDWVRSLRDQCTAAGVPFFFKQWGEYMPWSCSHSTNEQASVLLPKVQLHKRMMPDGTIPAAGLISREQMDDYMSRGVHMVKVGKKAAGRILDNREWNEFPTVNEVAR